MANPLPSYGRAGGLHIPRTLLNTARSGAKGRGLKDVNSYTIPSAIIIGPTTSTQKPTLKSDTSLSGKRLETETYVRGSCTGIRKG